jgi:hypothetical protein
MSSLEDGFGGGVEDMMSGAECQSGRITEESYLGSISGQSRTIKCFGRSTLVRKSTALFQIYPMMPMHVQHVQHHGIVTMSPEHRDDTATAQRYSVIMYSMVVGR